MPPLPQVGDIIAERYEIQAELGRGGMGLVYAARHTISGRKVALKWMSPDAEGAESAKERFLREARAMGRIEHTNVMAVLDVGTDGDAAFLVMDLLRGESLRSVVTNEAPVPHARALALMLPAMAGVEAAHRVGVIHRDLKPENLFVARIDGAEVTKVLDFGISKMRDDHRESSNKLTKTGNIVGTPQYMSPEQIRGTTIDTRTDIWALGTILYELLTGTMPFADESYAGLLVAIATGPFVPLEVRAPDVPPGIASVIHRALEKDPSARQASVMELARALEPFSDTRFVEPEAVSLPPPAPQAPALAWTDVLAPTHAGSRRP